MALAVALLSALCFATAMVTSRVGLRGLDARAGAAISIPTATVLLLCIAPFVLDLSALHLGAALAFAVIGLFFPVSVTIMTFRSNHLLGPTLTSAISATAPLFAVAAAALFLNERVPAQAAVSVIGVVLGVGLLTWRSGGVRAGFPLWALAWPVTSSLVRGLAQVAVKATLLVWASPFAAGLIGYLVSSATVLGVDRLRRGRREQLSRRDIAWFALTGVLNGSAVLLMYVALNLAPVWQVAPVVAAYPLITAAIGALFLRDEQVTWRMALGALVSVAAIVFLVAAPAGARP